MTTSIELLCDPERRFPPIVSLLSPLYLHSLFSLPCADFPSVFVVGKLDYCTSRDEELSYCPSSSSLLLFVVNNTHPTLL